MSNQIRVLMVDDSPEDTMLITRALAHGGFDPVCERVETAASLHAALDVHSWDLIICDYSVPQLNGLAALEVFLKKGLDIPFISISGNVGEETVAETLKAGAHDYVMKDHLERLVPAIKRELRAGQERRAKRQRETQLAFLAAIVESCEDAIIGEALDGTIVTWNIAAERLYGYTANEIVGRSISVLFPSYRPDELPDLLARVRQGLRVDRFETVRIRKDGTAVAVSLTISPIKDAGGTIIGASTVTRDITQRKREENERLDLIKDLTAALARAAGARLSPSSGAPERLSAAVLP